MTSGRVQVAERALQKGDLAGAIAAMEASVSKAPDDVRGRRQLADTYAKAGRFEEAIRELTRLAEAFAVEGLLLKASSAYKAILEIDPEHEGAKSSLASLQANKSSALADAARLADGNVPAAPPPPLPDDHSLEGDELVEADDVLQADDVVDANDILEADDVAEEIEHSDEAGPEAPVLDQTVDEQTLPQLAVPSLAEPVPSSADAEGTVEVERPGAQALDDATLEVAHLEIHAMDDATLEVGHPAAEVLEGGAASDAAEDADIAEEPEHANEADEAEAVAELAADEDEPAHDYSVEEDDLVEELSVEDADDLIVAEADSIGDDDVELDRSVLPELPLFSDLPTHAFEELISDLDQWRVPAGATIVRQGEVGHSFFVIVSGEARVERDGDVLATLGRGELFGEMALLSKNPRAASVVADSACELFEIKRERIDDLMTRYPSVQRVLQRFCRERLLSNVLRASLFAGLDERLAREMMRAFKTRNVPMGQRLVSQGDKGRGLFVVLAGTLDVSRSDDGQVRTVSQLGEGDVFGEMSLIFAELASASVMALSNATLLTLSQKGFQTFCKRHPVMKRRLEALARARRAGNAEASAGSAAE